MSYCMWPEVNENYIWARHAINLPAENDSVP